MGWARRRASRRPRRSRARTTCRTTEFPAPPGPRRSWRRRRSLRRSRSIRDNFYGSVGYDFDKVEQESYTARVEHDVNSNLTLRNQTRYNDTHREAVITAVQSPTSFVPETQTVTLARQGNERENDDPVEPDEPDRAIRRPAGSATRRMRASRSRPKSSSRRRWSALACANPSRASTRRTRSIRSPATTPRAASPTPTARRTPSACMRSTPSSSGRGGSSAAAFGGSTTTPAFKAVDAAGATTTDLISGRRPHQRQGGRALSGCTDAANVYCLVRIGRHAARHGELHAQLAAEQPEQPERQAAGVEELRGRQESRLLRQPAVAERARCSGPTTRTSSSPSMRRPFRRSSIRMTRQRVNGVHDRIARADQRRGGRCSPVSDISIPGRSARTPSNNGKRLTLTPEFSGSLWTTYDFPRGLTLGGGVRYHG